jgi:hypothetical protein
MAWLCAEQERLQPGVAAAAAARRRERRSRWARGQALALGPGRLPLHLQHLRRTGGMKRRYPLPPLLHRHHRRR